MLQALIHLIQLLKKLIALKAKFDKLDINKFSNVSTSLNNLKTIVYEAVKNTKINTLMKNANNLEKQKNNEK